MQSLSIVQLVFFAAAWAVGIYLVDCLLTRQIKHVQLKPALLYVSTMGMLGVIGEVSIGSFYNFLFGTPLWNYTVLPIHHAYTSQYALFLWGIYGLHLYLLHGSSKKGKPKSITWHALTFCIEAIAIEALVNLTFKLSFGRYIYYYFPSDLWHLTSVQTLPFYLAAGFIIFYAIRSFKADIKFYTAMCTSIAFVFVFLT